jgi:D-glycero-D-manno-heptose 1,7-bisphosphate phosphatase
MPIDRLHQRDRRDKRRAVFFDRDGTLMEDTHYCADPALVKVFPGVPEALRSLKDAGFAIFVITNQSGIGRGLISEAQYHAVEEEFLRQAGRDWIDGSYYCPDVPGIPSACRKPEPGMVLEAAAAHRIDLAASYFVGDKSIDIECGQRAGTRTVLVLTGYGSEQGCTADLICRDAVEAAEKIIGNFL